MSLQCRSHRRNFSDFSMTFLAYLLLLESFDSVKLSFESFSITYHVLLALFCWPCELFPSASSCFYLSTSQEQGKESQCIKEIQNCRKQSGIWWEIIILAHFFQRLSNIKHQGLSTNHDASFRTGKVSKSVLILGYKVFPFKGQQKAKHTHTHVHTHFYYSKVWKDPKEVGIL